MPDPLATSVIEWRDIALEVVNSDLREAESLAQRAGPEERFRIEASARRDLERLYPLVVGKVASRAQLGEFRANLALLTMVVRQQEGKA